MERRYEIKKKGRHRKDRENRADTVRITLLIFKYIDERIRSLL
jgi:hypothetical protein